jgi:hypothetical protein
MVKLTAVEQRLVRIVARLDTGQYTSPDLLARRGRKLARALRADGWQPPEAVTGA